MPKTKAEVAKMVRVNKTKQYSKLSTEQQQAKYKSIMESPRKDTAVAKIELSVLRKLFLASKKSAKKTAAPAPKKPAPAPKKPAPKKTPAPSRKSIEKEAITDAKKKYNNFTLKQLLKERKRIYDESQRPKRTNADYAIQFAKNEVIYDLLKKFTKNHFAQVEIQGYGTVNWDGYNLYERGLFRAETWSKLGTYTNEKDLDEWRDYGIAQAFTKYDPLELKRDAPGLKLLKESTWGLM